MEELLRQHLARCAAAYSEEKGVSKPALGLTILRDNTFFRRAVDERQGFTVRTYDRVMRWFAANWPANAIWPDDVPRPDLYPPPSATVATRTEASL